MARALPSRQGAFPRPGGTEFRVWAPRAKALSVELSGGEVWPLHARPGGSFERFLEGVEAGCDYQYVFEDGRRRPDPASRLQRGAVRGASTVADLDFPWTDGGWKGVSAGELVFYELHVGAFTADGTFDGVLERLPSLARLGVTALELMPIAAWDGPRGWGYDGVLLYAPHPAYGPPAALQRLVDACHRHGLAVFLDVVYNHVGPSGSSLRDFGPYFAAHHHTPWGAAFNYDGEDSGPVRSFIIDNALHWLRDYHFDGLRLDSVENIIDRSKRHVVAELSGRVQALAATLRRQLHLVAEGGMRDPTVVRPLRDGGWGAVGRWSDDFHHALHALLTSESRGPYRRFGRLHDLAQVYRRGTRGQSFVVAAQNHDQIGNRPQGDRLTALLSPEALRLAATATILSPFTPLLFMGEEYAETAPFQYFTSFGDPGLGRSVLQGRRRELRVFGPKAKVVDPQDRRTFERSKLHWERLREGGPSRMRRYYEALLALRRSEPRLLGDRIERVSTELLRRRTLLVRRSHGEGDALLILHFSSRPTVVRLPPGRWRQRIDSWAPPFCRARTWQLEHSVYEGQLPVGPYHATLLLGPAAK